MEKIGEVINMPGFPMQWKSPFIKTSEADTYYNCIAWAIGHKWTWYEPRLKDLPYTLPKHLQRWPPSVPNEYTQEAFTQFFEYHGFERCADGDLEPGYTKVALFFAPIGPARPHACRQLPNGKWASKMGTYEDVEHTLESLERSNWGPVVQFLRKKGEITVEECAP